MPNGTKKSRVKKPKFNVETVHLDDFEDYLENEPALEGFDNSFITDETSTSDIYEKLEEFLKGRGWTYRSHWYTSDSDAASFSADEVTCAVNDGHTQALIIDDDGDNAYFWSK